MPQKKSDRYAWSPAYIDSGLVGAFLFGVVLFAVWIASITSTVIAPWWLGVSIVAVVVYQSLIYWLLRQYWEVDKIFAIFISNIVCLSLIFLLVESVTNIYLPVDMPVLNIIYYLSDFQATSYGPGSVALSYAVLGLLAGYITMFSYSVIDDQRWTMKLKSWLGLSKVDLIIDKALDKYSFWMDRTNYPWLITPQIALVALVAIVVGSAALI